MSKDAAARSSWLLSGLKPSSLLVMRQSYGDEGAGVWLHFSECPLSRRPRSPKGSSELRRASTGVNSTSDSTSGGPSSPWGTEGVGQVDAGDGLTLGDRLHTHVLRQMRK